MANSSAGPNNPGPATRRKQTLLTLLDALNELTKDGDLTTDLTQEPNFEDDHDVPTVDEHLQKMGAETFHRFQRRLNNFDKELRNFANASRQLGSSVGILSSTFHLRSRLTVINYLFHENAADLFPRKIAHQSSGALEKPAVTIMHRKGKHKAPPHARRPVLLEPPDAEAFPEQIGALAKDVMTFLQCLNEFPEFTDEAVNASISAFDGDLRYWASCLKSYEGQFKYPAVQRYLHDLTTEMGDHIETITTSLSMFIEIGVPTIRFAQKHGANNLLNLSTVATFFSAVTATTLQFSFDQTGTGLADAVNGFWFTSMVFSIAAAVNSLLGLTWKQAMYRSPGHRVPWWVLIWIKRSPLVFLVLSVACFSVGLVLFAYSSGQHHTVCTMVTVFTAFSSFGLTAVSTWFASERWVFSRHKGQKWLSDTLDDVWDRFVSIAPITWTRRNTNVLLHSVDNTRSEMLGRVRHFFRAFFSLPKRLLRRRRSDLSTTISGEITTSYAHAEKTVTTDNVLRASESATDPPTARSPTAASTSELLSEKDGTTASAPDTPTTLSPVRARFANMVRSVIMMQAASSLTNPRRGRSVSAGVGLDGRKDSAQLPVRSTRIAALVSKLHRIAPSEDIPAHTALVRHLQFSPNGKFLATSSWDRTSVILQVGEPFRVHRTLAHPSGFVSQVAWSPSGNLLLTKLTRSIKVWTEDGVCMRTIERYRNVQSICWLPGGEAFLSVEGGFVAKLDLMGNELDQYRFDRLKIHDVTVTPDGQRLLGVGILLSSVDGLHPSKCRAEKQIISYNLERKEIENQVPVLHDIRDITFAKNGQFALVSYEFKAPPQLWKLEMVKTRVDPNGDQTNITSPTSATMQTSRLSLRHTYMPKFPVDFAGPSYFGGKDDQLVLCAGKAGDIHIWDRESGALLHHIRSQAYGGGDLTCIAWNPSLEPYMFATGSHDGAVRTWTTSPNATAPPSIIEPQIERDRSPRPTMTPRSVTPLSQTSESQYFEGSRTESPTQQEFPPPGDTLSPLPMPRRTVAFNDSQSFGSFINDPSSSTRLPPPPPP